MRLTGGELLARCLAREGVKYVFGLMSPEVDPLLAALEENGMQFVPVRHEAAAAYMAEGIYKTTGQVAATVTNPGPGTANLLPGALTARHEGVPFIAITAQHQLNTVFPCTPRTFQGQDQLDLFRPVVKWGAPILAWDRIPEITRMAFREMWAGRPGPVQLEITTSVMYAEGDEAAVPLLDPGCYRGGTPQAGRRQIAQVAEMLRTARRPLVLTGSGVDRADAGALVEKLAALLGCGVITTLAGRSSFPHDHPQHLYGYGAGADLARQEADVLLAFGTRLGNIDTPFTKYWGDGASQHLIQIDLDPRNLGAARPLSFGIVSDIGIAIEDLLIELGTLEPRENGPEDLERYRKAELDWRREEFMDTSNYEGAALHPAHVMQQVGSAFGGEAIYVTDGGFTSLWAHFMLPSTRARSYLNILEMGMLGTGIPSAVGAKLANPDRDVICVTGDGAAGFHFMELQTAVREGAKTITVIFSEGSWSMEVPNEEARYGKTFGTEMGPIRWDQVAIGLGCTGFFVQNSIEFGAALANAKDSNCPVVICVRTDRSANLSIPPKIALRFHEGYQGLSM
ncbi:thiamine pyrophosphate-binding protein [Sphingopyxis granuli]|jgi:acetolactate synthase-1/2/3 large subunit|uniref:thiamine pyrophosphate-binding protein n=1 Tax=Sphingopyxis granuli TaxID=267128 RepID=UPI00301E403C